MRHLLIESIQDTIRFSENELKEATKESMASNIVYEENFRSMKQVSLDVNGKIIVIESTTFDAARLFITEGRTAVLNFANPVKPGGGVLRGAKAQEECLCRSSNLYPCLSANNVYSLYYGYHQNKDYKFSDRLIYTKNICVFKDDKYIPKLLPENEWINVDVITCAAPYRPGLLDVIDEQLKDIFKLRIRNIFEASIDNGVNVLILGAFGCGAFANPPSVVSMAFKEVIDENCYLSKIPNIIFAIKKSLNPNFNVFSSMFKDYFQDK